MSEKELRKRFLPCRISDAELQAMKNRYAKTNCSSFSEFIRKVLLQDKIIALTRNQSLDDMLEELVRLRKEINLIGRNINQATRRLETGSNTAELRFWAQEITNAQQLLAGQESQIQLQINRIADKWLQE